VCEIQLRVAGVLALVLLAGTLVPSSLWAESLSYPYFHSELQFPELLAAQAGGQAEAATAESESKAAGEERSYELNGAYFKDMLYDAGYILTSPLSWDTGDWVTASLVLGGTGTLLAFDDDIQEWVQDRRGGGTDTAADIGEPFGNGLYVVPALGVFYGWGHFMDNERARRVGLLGIESYLISGAISLTLKAVTGRHRPSEGDGAHEWDPFQFNGNMSFPSGHTTTAFAVATVVATEYDENPLVATLAYGLATLTAYSRMNDNKHFASDVFLGGAIGYFTAKTVMKLHDDKRMRHFTIFPRVSRQEAGLSLAMQF